MHTQPLVKLAQNVGDRLPHPVDARVAHRDRVHVDDGVNAGLLPDQPLGLVDQLVHRDDIRRVGHLGVQGGQRLAHAVIMHDQVVHAHDARTAADHPLDLRRDLRVARLTDQGAEGVARDAEARPQDEQGDEHAHHAVHRQGGEPPRDHAEQDDAGRYDVI